MKAEKAEAVKAMKAVESVEAVEAAAESCRPQDDRRLGVGCRQEEGHHRDEGRWMDLEHFVVGGLRVEGAAAELFVPHVTQIHTLPDGC